MITTALTASTCDTCLRTANVRARSGRSRCFAKGKTAFGTVTRCAQATASKHRRLAQHQNVYTRTRVVVALCVHPHLGQEVVNTCAAGSARAEQHVHIDRFAAQHNSVAGLGQLRPQLQHEWHPHKNKHLGTVQQNPFSFARAVWRCPDCHNEWQARIIDRAYDEAGCQQCAQRMSCALSELPFMSQWDHTSNAAAGIYPDQVSMHSHNKVFWICCKCPQKWPHEWQQSPFDRAQCPYLCCPQCDGKQACICNSAPRRV